MRQCDRPCAECVCVCATQERCCVAQTSSAWATFVGYVCWPRNGAFGSLPAYLFIHQFHSNLNLPLYTVSSACPCNRTHLSLTLLRKTIRPKFSFYPQSLINHQLNFFKPLHHVMLLLSFLFSDIAFPRSFFLFPFFFFCFQLSVNIFPPPLQLCHCRLHHRSLSSSQRVVKRALLHIPSIT